jgi:hypothetical protein
VASVRIEAIEETRQQDRAGAVEPIDLTQVDIDRNAATQPHLGAPNLSRRSHRVG